MYNISIHYLIETLIKGSLNTKTLDVLLFVAIHG